VQTNLTDGDSGLMRKNKKNEYQQSYNAQAVVDAEGSQLVLGARVSGCGSDRRELVADVETVAESVGVPTQVLADNGYAYQQAVERLRDRGMKEAPVRERIASPKKRRPPPRSPTAATLGALPAAIARTPHDWLERLFPNR